MLEFLFWIIFIFVVIGYVFKLFLRYGLPWLITRFMNKQQNKYSNSFDPSNFNNQKTAEGEVNINSGKKKKPEENKDDFGEYVDFEDVE